MTNCAIFIVDDEDQEELVLQDTAPPTPGATVVLSGVAYQVGTVVITPWDGSLYDTQSVAHITRVQTANSGGAADESTPEDQTSTRRIEAPERPGYGHRPNT